MKIIPIFNFKLLPGSYYGLTLYPFVFFYDSRSEVLYKWLKHESIHVAQVRRVGWLRFYLSYVIYFVAGLIHYTDWNLAYYSIPFEREARSHELTPLTIAEAEELGVI